MAQAQQNIKKDKKPLFRDPLITCVSPPPLTKRPSTCMPLIPLGQGGNKVLHLQGKRSNKQHFESFCNKFYPPCTFILIFFWYKMTVNKFCRIPAKILTWFYFLHFTSSIILTNGTAWVIIKFIRKIIKIKSKCS